MSTRTLRALVLFVGLHAVGCNALDIGRPPPPTAEEYGRGLIVFYPGSSNMYIESIGFYNAFKEAGVDQAIEVVPWSGFLTHQVFPETEVPAILEFARQEAARLAEYIRDHPKCPVTILTYSGGALMALETAAAMPADTPVDRVITMSPGLWRDYDLGRALDGTTQGVLYYWSPQEENVELVAAVFGTADGHFEMAAAGFGFSYQDPRLIEVVWTPEMAALGNNGGHLDYIVNIEFIKAVVVPWLATHRVEPT
jgi:pimeloyl-ACP methyl ester carboxylesterase